MHLKHFRALVALLASLPVAALATYDVDIMTPVTPMSRDSYNLHWGILWVCVAIFVIVFGTMFWSIFRHRKSRGAVAAQFHENTTIEILWTIVPFIVLIGMAYPATRTMIEMKDPSGADMAIKITAYQWRWEYEYQQDGLKFVSNLSTPRDQIENYNGAGPTKNDNYLLEVDNAMVVPVGKKVRLLITSNDVIHGWYVPQLGVNQYGIPGFIKEAWFTIDKPGIYRGQCSQICGKEHAYMPIVVDARSDADYAAWVKDAKAKNLAAPAEPAPAPAPAEQTAAAAPAAAGAAAAPTDGKTVFDTTCTACHSTGAAGAPKFGDKAAWAPRLGQGKAALYNAALHGKGAMPPRGGNTTLSDDAVKAAVDYMAAAAK